MHFLSLWRLIRPVSMQMQKDNFSPKLTTQCIWCVCLIVRIYLIRCSTSYGEGWWWSELVKCISLFNSISNISEWKTIFLSFNWVPFSVSLYTKKSFRYCQILLFFLPEYTISITSYIFAKAWPFCKRWVNFEFVLLFLNQFRCSSRLISNFLLVCPYISVADHF